MHKKVYLFQFNLGDWNPRDDDYAVYATVLAIEIKHWSLYARVELVTWEGLLVEQEMLEPFIVPFVKRVCCLLLVG